MARNVNISIEGWHWTGRNVRVRQAAVNLTIRWVDDQGQWKEHSETVQFPNCLSEVPLPWVQEMLEDLMPRVLRKKLDIE